MVSELLVFSWYSNVTVPRIHSGASFTFDIFITTAWLVELIPSLAITFIE